MRPVRPRALHLSHERYITSAWFLPRKALVEVSREEHAHVGRPGKILIGTSGWSYSHWRGIFYPPDVASANFLAFYTQKFPTVEINSSFYHLPRATTIARWASTTPAGFCFAVKASRYITHLLRLRNCAEPLQAFFTLVRGFGNKLGPVLFQLPPGLHRDTDLLAEFLALLPPDLRVAIEFRHKSWYENSVFALLVSHGVALCLHDMRGSEAPPEPTAPFVYLRFHGPQQAYTGSYEPSQLARRAAQIGEWAASGRDVYAYFNNDIGGYAVQNAQELRCLVDLAGKLGQSSDN